MKLLPVNSIVQVILPYNLTVFFLKHILSVRVGFKRFDQGLTSRQSPSKVIYFVKLTDFTRLGEV